MANINLISNPFSVQKMPSYAPSVSIGGVVGVFESIVQNITGYLQHAKQCQVEIERIQAQRAITLKSIDAQAKQHLLSMKAQLLQALQSNQQGHEQRMRSLSILEQEFASVQQLRKNHSQGLQQIMDQILKSRCTQERGQLMQFYALHLSGDNFVEEITQKMQTLLSVLPSEDLQRLT